MDRKQAFVPVLRQNLKKEILSGNQEDAADLLARLKEEDPLSVETRGLELEYLIRFRHTEDARALVGQLLALFPGSARIQYLAGRLYYQLRDYENAQRHFAESVTIHPSGTSERWLGKTLTQLNRLAEAEPLLLSLVARDPHCRGDLAWLYERKGEIARALEHAEAHLERYPNDELVRSQVLRLRAHGLDSEDLVDEVETLLALGEAVPDALLPPYLERLLQSGQSARARLFVRQHHAEITPRQAVSMAWICRNLQAYDLALELFLTGLPERRGDYKYLNALEQCARHCRRIEEVIERYEEHAPDQRGLYGRIRKLRKRLDESGF